MKRKKKKSRMNGDKKRINYPFNKKRSSMFHIRDRAEEVAKPITAIAAIVVITTIVFFFFSRPENFPFFFVFPKLQPNKSKGIYKNISCRFF
jgi:hypothetical protein